LPTRIVDVGAGDGSENPKLLETRELRAEYVALSHCWGPPESHPLKTTWSNLHSHQSEIPWVAIPKTFQDAISTVRGLGLRYIWIDSLCIVQDDSDEWLRESKRMNSVYQNAVLTLASCHSPDAHTGCYLPRPPMPPSAGLPNFMESSCNAGTLRCSGEENEASVFLALPHQSYRSLSPESSPLAVRAWATQEWLLSRRMVFFTEGSLTWSCKTYTQRETGEKCHNTARNPKWKHIIEHYSIRKLSHWTDRMVALEGLAAELQPLIRGVYRWGIWENGCPDQLFWYAKPSTTPAQPRVRYNPLGAPTWSWVS
ncbi:HET-domain-containing protein, partial [Eremomyces bilateralis CBS 781.70]